MSTELTTESAINEAAASVEQARYAAAWEASTQPPPTGSGIWAAVRRLAGRRSTRVITAAALLAAVGGAAWIYRRRRDR